MTVPESLSDPELRPVWEVVRSRLERTGVDNRGRVRLPPLSPGTRHVLESVAGRKVTSMVPLDALEMGLIRLGVGTDLADALANLGEPVSREPALRRAARSEAAEGRRQARQAVAEWPDEWATEWIDGEIRAGALAGMGPDEATRFVGDVRKVLGELPGAGDPPVSQVDLAVRVLGHAHALDDDRRIAASVGRALGLLFPGADDPWERAGIQGNLVSGAALTWGLEARPGTELASLLDNAASLGVPLHLSRLMLRRYPFQPPDGIEVLVVENPRVVEAACERGHRGAVVTTNGNPSTAVRLLLDQLLAGGAQLRYHGDFDPGGLAICARVYHSGIRPFRMDTADYLEAVRTAGVELPISEKPAGPTPWDPDLQAEFNRQRRIVHEELLLDRILGAH